jgi:hypothetical protein
MRIAGHFPRIPFKHPRALQPGQHGFELVVRSLRSPQMGDHLGGRSQGYQAPPGRCAIGGCTAKCVTSDTAFCVVHEPDEG